MHDTLRAIKARRDSEDEGFTLIELMVVVLIIAILIAIAIPTFLGARSRAQDRAAQSNLRNSLTNAKSIFTDSQSYTGATPAAMQSSEPSMTYVAGNVVVDTTSGPKTVSVETDAANSAHVVLATMSKSGQCYAISDDASTTGKGTKYAKLAAASCDGDGAIALAAGSWSDSW